MCSGGVKLSDHGVVWQRCRTDACNVLYFTAQGGSKAKKKKTNKKMVIRLRRKDLARPKNHSRFPAETCYHLAPLSTSHKQMESQPETIIPGRSCRVSLF